MNELINTDAGLTMSSLEISELVEKRHDNVKRTIESLADHRIIVRPQIEDVQNRDELGRSRTTKVYQVGKRDSYVIVAQLSPEFTARLVDRWQELESQQPAFDPSKLSRIEILTMAIQAEEENQQLKAKIEVDQPKVEFAEKVVVAPDAISVSKAAKVLGTGRSRLYTFLRQIGWVTRKNEPYQNKIEAGYLDVKLGNWDHPDYGLQQSVTALVTGKGLAKLQQLWSCHHVH